MSGRPQAEATGIHGQHWQQMRARYGPATPATPTAAARVLHLLDLDSQVAPEEVMVWWYRDHDAAIAYAADNAERCGLACLGITGPWPEGTAGVLDLRHPHTV